MIKVLLIDDEKHCLITLEFILKQLDEVQIIGMVQNSNDGIKLVEEFNPDIVFLDIEMPNQNGFDFLAQFTTIPFKVIFTTAYDQYAVKALRMNALDYLLKPIDKTDLIQALDNYKIENQKITDEQIQNLHLFRNGKIQDTIALSTQSGLIFIKIEEIMYLEASSSYTYLIMKDKTKHLASKTMATFEDVLIDNPIFFRAHKSHIVNLKSIKQYIRGDGGELILEDGKSVSLSRSKKQEFLELFMKI
ncbi:LytR/AlgR family response regulator transcription factor [Fluviicola taffensis]|uniref:Two component transcriptional regulator, LytTR family n=1 Tax=Fluviicola taffensis (strain DSM 16823 / NCIMB 13979 / RW262) TaxID=755732 RepID=F2IIQ6_FLUTR|nr:LytTR family DNA-binding domain-containing protein [Fluviicola taffensis]AEA46018.1 two component transcriptional regulator, LytTR family [Fluviicola taffensis DSM 16823]